MLVEEFNAMPPHEAADAVRPCAAIDSWVAAIVAGRPYDEVADVVALADAQARTWTTAEVEHALAGHPRIGEQPTEGGAGAAMSRLEQGRVATDADARADADGPGRGRLMEGATDEQWLTRAVGLAVANVAAGGGPFGAVVVRAGVEVGEGQNRGRTASPATSTRPRTPR